MKILISAYVCSPDTGSESEVGWRWAVNLSRFHEIVVLTKRPPSVDKVNELIKGNKNLRFEYYDLPGIFDFMRTGDVRHFLYYNLWQIGAYFHARRLVQREHFDLAHHLVYVNTWQPTYMGFLGIPFLFGPIGENPRVPPVIARHYGAKVVLREQLTGFVKDISRNISPLMRAVYKRAVKVIAINSYVYSKIGSRFRKKTVVYPAIGAADPDDAVIPSFNQNEKKFRVLYVGKLSYIKCPNIALNAFLRFAEMHDDVEFTIIGSGPLHHMLKRDIEASMQKHKVVLLPWQKRNIAMSYMKGCDVFLFPSCEGGGMVFLEAMSFGKPVICLDYGGGKDFITSECGIKVGIGRSMDEIEAALAESLEKLYSSNTMRTTMGAAARKRFIELYDWKQKALWMDNLYRSLKVDN